VGGIHGSIIAGRHAVSKVEIRKVLRSFISPSRSRSRTRLKRGMPAAHLPPPGLLRCVLDTDTFNEVDDQFALAWMAKRPDRFDLLAVTAAPFHNGHSTGPADGMRKSVEEAERVLRLCGRGEVPVVPGSERFMLEGGPVESPAARRIIELAQEKPLHVVAIGALTNVASALRLEPGLKDRITLHWLGGHRPPEALNR
jgi:inosine-uridine nucleoside N-ribohydrolase